MLDQISGRPNEAVIVLLGSDDGVTLTSSLLAFWNFDLSLVSEEIILSNFAPKHWFVCEIQNV